MMNRKKTYSTFCFDRIILKKDKLIKNKDELNELVAQYVYHLRRCGLSDNKIYEMLLVYQFIKVDKSLTREEIVERLVQDYEEIECYEYYGRFDRTNLFCRACDNCVINNNQFREIEYKLLLLCLYNEKMVEMVSSFEKDGPIFNCVETDDFYNENKSKGVSPSFVFPFTRLFFDEVVINKMSEEGFLNSLGAKYGDEKMVFECARKLINQLTFEKSTLRRTPVNKNMAKKYAIQIHDVFGRSHAFPPIGLTSKVKGEERFKQVNILEEINSSVEEKIKDEVKEIGVINKEKGKKQIGINKDVDLHEKSSLKEDLKLKANVKQNINQEDVNEDKKVMLLECPSCRFVLKMDVAKLEDVYNIENNNEVFSIFENGILKDGFISCRLVENEGELYILCYVRNLSKYFYCNLSYEKGLDMLSFYMAKKSFKIYTDMPWLLIGEFYNRKNIMCSNVKSLYQMYLFLYEKDRYSFINMIYDILGCAPSGKDNVFLYTLSKLQPACDLLENEIQAKNKTGELEDIDNVDLVYGISMAKLNDEELFYIDNNGLMKYENNAVNDTRGNVCFKFIVEVKNNFEQSINSCIRDKIISRYVRDGKLKKCIPTITNINQDSYIFKVENEEEYEFIFNLFIFYSRCIVNENQVSFKTTIVKV